MKSLLTILFLLGGLTLFAQSKIDSGLVDFIKTRNYVQLTDTAHLPKSFLPYLHFIKDNLSAQKYAAPADVYVEVAHVEESSYGLTVPVIDLTGVKFIKRQYDAAIKTIGAIKAKDTIINGRKYETIPADEILLAAPIGDPSGGRERVLKINKADGTIATYLTQ